jgi:hypothetical protein
VKTVEPAKGKGKEQDNALGNHLIGRPYRVDRRDPNGVGTILQMVRHQYSI